MLTVESSVAAVLGFAQIEERRQNGVTVKMVPGGGFEPPTRGFSVRAADYLNFSACTSNY